jgi:acylglycerol lipase
VHVQTCQACPRYRFPSYWSTGTGDIIVDPATSNYVRDTIGSTDRTLKLYDGLWHQVFNEPERESVYTDVKTWLTQHTDTA